MKKIIFGSAAAIIAVAGFSSFKAHKASKTNTYYWLVKTGDGGASPFHNADLSTYFGTTEPTNPTCTTGTSFDCVVGFITSQVTGIGSSTKLKTTSLEGQAPTVVPFKRIGE
jgi:hypothetical protein